MEEYLKCTIFYLAKSSETEKNDLQRSEVYSSDFD